MRIPLAVAVMSLALFGCEPAFIDQCKQECDCTGDSFACRAPKSGGCDNSWRRAWTLASMAGCETQYTVWFDCVHAKSVCTSAGTGDNASYDAPAGSCDSLRDTLESCCSGGKCDG
jgi:hypothetical protein